MIRGNDIKLNNHKNKKSIGNILIINGAKKLSKKILKKGDKHKKILIN